MTAAVRLLVLVVCGGYWLDVSPAWAIDLTAIEKTIGKQPAYKTKPRYCLLVFGAEAKIKVWMVEDDKTLYIDRNANGDLTDDGPPLQPTNSRNLGKGPTGSQNWDFDYVLDRIEPLAGPAQTKFRLARWNYGDPEDRYGLSVTLHDDPPADTLKRTKVSATSPSAQPKTAAEVAANSFPDEGIAMYAGWFDKLWASSPETASILHFGGPIEPRLLRLSEGQGPEFIVDSGVRRLSVCLVTPGLGEAGPARLSEYAIPLTTPMRVRIDWPVAEGSEPLVTYHKLGKHCCYWEYYDDTFRVPQDKRLVAGLATVTVELPQGKFPLPLRKNQVEVPVRLTEDSQSPAAGKK
ncbi:MAG: hypothetical protein JSS02_01235 [Planctomycetes bacterium]|nr:hypothetical protein [Planctomycetota bacterium]